MKNTSLTYEATFLSCRTREMNTDLLPILHQYASNSNTQVRSFVRDAMKNNLNQPLFLSSDDKNTRYASLSNDIAMTTYLPELSKNRRQILLVTPNNYYYDLFFKESATRKKHKKQTLSKYSHILVPNPFIKKMIQKHYAVYFSQKLITMQTPYHWDLLKSESIKSHYKEFLQLYPQAKGKKILFFMLPQKISDTTQLLWNQFRFPEFLSHLGEDWIVITNNKTQLLRTLAYPGCNFDQVLYINRQYPLEHLMYFCHFLITDISFFAVAQAHRDRPFFCMNHNDNSFEKYMQKNHPALFLQTPDDLFSINFSSVALTKEHHKLYKDLVCHQDSNPISQVEELLLF